VGEGGDEVSVARFIADQRTKYQVPHVVTCVLLGVSVSWFYKWIARAGSTDGLHTDTDRRRAAVDAAVATAFAAARGLHGSPRLIDDLRDLGWEVSEKTVADSMRRQGLVARRIRRRNGLTKQDRTAPKFPDLVKRDFTAGAPNLKWVGDFKCRRRHLKSYADPRNMPTTAAMVQANGGNEVQKVGIDA
jgi:hypothetical protein